MFVNWHLTSSFSFFLAFFLAIFFFRNNYIVGITKQNDGNLADNLFVFGDPFCDSPNLSYKKDNLIK